MKHSLSQLFVIAVLLGPCPMYLSAAQQELTTPQIFRKAQPCLFRVQASVSITKTVPVGTKMKKVTQQIGSQGTGFSIADTRLHILSALIAKPNAKKKSTLLNRHTNSIELGYVVTNSHVACPRGMKPDRISLINELTGITFSGKLVGHDPESDLAVIQVLTSQYRLDHELKKETRLIVGTRLRALRFADPRQIEPGQDVVAIGFALGLRGTPSVTQGIVSGLDRELAKGLFSGLLQTSATINKGNSGGPLLNRRGEVVGVNTYLHPTRLQMTLDVAKLDDLLKMKRSKIREGGTTIERKGTKLHVSIEAPLAQGVFYARSSETAEPIVRQLIRSGKIKRANLGILRVTLKAGFPRRPGDLEGVGVLAVVKDSLAAKAGLKPGDVITQFGNQKILNVGDLNNALALAVPGTTATLKYVRRIKVTIKMPSVNRIPVGTKPKSPLSLPDRTTLGGQTFTTFSYVQNRTLSTVIPIPR